MQKNELHNLPPPWEFTKKGVLVNMSTEEEVRVMKRSESAAEQILSGNRQNEGDSVELTYNEYIHAMRVRGIAKEFANIALENFGLRPGPDAQLISR